ncbi:MAG: hypothetical protein Q9163_003911 [Psora crenata]
MSRNQRDTLRAAIKHWLNRCEAKAPQSHNLAFAHDRGAKHEPKGHAGHDNRLANAQRPGKYAWNRVGGQRRRDKDLSAHAAMQAQSRDTAPDARFRDSGGSMYRSRKRRRSSSLQSTYLEPAPVVDLPRLPSNLSPYNRHHERDSSNREPAEDHINPPSLAGRLNTPVTYSKAIKSYERRPRHKTRQDRYELKQGIEAKECPSSKAGLQKRAKKQKHKEKTGAALMHHFKAENVSDGRLTLKPSKALGLFGKGRASSPVKRRALPDLGFSELEFLNSRREKPSRDWKEDDNKKGRKQRKAEVREAEISSYFTPGKFLGKQDPQQVESFKWPSVTANRHQRDRPPSFIDLPKEPFLGFGSCGTHSGSPVKIIKELDARYVPPWSQRDTGSPPSPTSYLTWSCSDYPAKVSPGPRAGYSREQQQQRPLALPSYERLHTTASPKPASCPEFNDHRWKGSAIPDSTREAEGYPVKATDTRRSSDRYRTRNDESFRRTPPLSVNQTTAKANRESTNLFPRNDPGASHGDASIISRRPSHTVGRSPKVSYPIDLGVKQDADCVIIDKAIRRPSSDLDRTPVESRGSLSLNASADVRLEDCELHPRASLHRPPGTSTEQSVKENSVRGSDLQAGMLKNRGPLQDCFLEPVASMSPGTCRLDASPAHVRQRMTNRGIAGDFRYGWEAAKRLQDTPQRNSSYPMSDMMKHQQSYFLPLQETPTGNGNARNGYGQLYEQQQDRENLDPETLMGDGRHRYGTRLLDYHKSPLLESDDAVYGFTQSICAGQAVENCRRGCSVAQESAIKYSSRGGRDTRDIEQVKAPAVLQFEQHHFPETDSRRPQLHVSRPRNQFVEPSPPGLSTFDEPKNFWTPHKLY